MTLQQQLKPLLQQFSNSVGRGNLIAANSTLVTMIEYMAKAIDAPCACNCGPASLQSLPPLTVVVHKPEPPVPVEDVVVEKRGRGRPKKVR